MAVIELDKRDKNIKTPVLYQITDKDEKVVKSHSAIEWGEFFRYNYLQFDFSEVKEEGLYQVRYGNPHLHISHCFRYLRAWRLAA